MKLSNPTELQNAIDGNRREGRRSSYGNYGDTCQPPMLPLQNLQSLQNLQNLQNPLSLVPRPQLNGNGTAHPLAPQEYLLEIVIIFNICMCTATLGNIAITRCSVITYVNDEPTAAAAAGGRGRRASVQMIDIPRPIGKIQA
ncbi:Protein dead ringer [Portunus trituberculatus]|uniref:Protein dead ringer n=1 Tax=Portunus trituberculatus TaxID=210409 RepID=A0A5B7EY42_PORTR|nr:Protein dead ringer [Portunus trituberculatus]